MSSIEMQDTRGSGRGQDPQESLLRQARRDSNRPNCLSSWTFHWVWRLVSYYRIDPATRHSKTPVPWLDTLNDNQTCRGAYEYFAPFWKEELRGAGDRDPDKPALGRALRRAYWKQFISIGGWKFLHSFFIFLGSWYVVRGIIVWTGELRYGSIHV